MLTDFFIRNLDVVFFIYGLVFIIFGIIIFSQLRVTEKSEYKLLNILWLLAFFGITHGIHEFIEMFLRVKDNPVFLLIIGPAFLFISYLSLFLFGYQLINFSRKKNLSIWFPLITIILFYGFLIYSLGSSFWNHDRLEILARYFLGFPSGILSAIGFLLYYQSESEKLSEIKVKKYFIYTALLFGIYGILGGLITHSDNFFPASIINYNSFISLFFGIPVLVFRAMIAVGITLSLWHIMNIFNIEEASERKHAEEKIQDQASLLDKAQDAIIVRDLEHRIIYWNKSAAQLYGFTEEEAAGKNANELLYKEESSALFEARKRVIEEGEWTGELRQVTKEGKEIMVESRWTLVRDSEGRPKSILVINTDVTEKRRLLSEIAERKKVEETLGMFAIALEEAPDGVRILDPNGYVIYSNKAIEKIFGFSNEELKGKHISEFYSDPDFSDRVVFPAVRETGHWNGEIMLKSRDGKEIPIWLNTSIVKDSKGEPVAFVGILRDISYLKEKEKLEKKLLQADKLAMIGQLASGVAHEINNPLGNISLYAQMLLKKIQDENDRNKLNIINDESNRAAYIVKGLLDFARQSEPKMIPTDVNAEIRKTLDLFKYKMKDIKVTTIFQTLPEINCDPGQIIQVIMNLLTNSIQSITENGEIKIETRSEKNNVEIVITDNGRGIPEENVNRIFEPFFTTKKPGEGTGLGLSISYGIVKSHNGSIEVKSQKGKGTSFIIKLPIH